MLKLLTDVLINDILTHVLLIVLYSADTKLVYMSF
jgi:hypothetical protein